MNNDHTIRELTPTERTMYIGDKDLVEDGIEAIADDLVRIFAAAGIEIGITEIIEDNGDEERQVATIGSVEAVLVDFGEDALAWDESGARTHMVRVLRAIRSAYGTSSDGAAWQLANLDEDFVFVLVTPEELGDWKMDTDSGWVILDIA